MFRDVLLFCKLLPFISFCGGCRSQDVRWVLLGDVDRVSTEDQAEPQLLEVVGRFTPNSGRKPKELYHDIALLQLSTEVDMTRFVRPACLWTEPTLEDNNDAFVATGWGDTTKGENVLCNMGKIKANESLNMKND